MDTSSDFLQPEFLNIVFFQQKNLVIFPYVDLKHLHGLEIFTAGYNVVNLESTALHNLKEILEFESTNSYSQKPTLYFIFNVDRQKVKDLMKLEGIRCIINSNENVGDLANGNNFIFFNKKNNQFLNYDLTANDLDFENSLMNDSQDEDILQEHIQKIKIVATRIFKELNHSDTLEKLPEILGEYNKNYWNSILEFTGRYYDINIPDISSIKFKTREDLKNFSDEYEILISTNRVLGKEFIQLLHDYRSKRVNPAHLELDELYNPQKLYNYLRNHHWEKGIPEEFIQEWHQMKISDYHLNDSDESDFEMIMKELGFKNQFNSSSPNKSLLLQIELNKSDQKIHAPPSPKTDWNKYKSWINNHLLNLEQFCSNDPISTNNHSYLLRNMSDLVQLFKRKMEKDSSEILVDREDQNVLEKIKLDVVSRLKRLRIEYWIELFSLKDTFQFVVRFIAQLHNFYDELFGRDDSKEMPLKIKKFNFPKNLERKLLIFNKFRNKISHKDIRPSQIDSILKTNQKHINNTYLHFLSYLIKNQVIHVVGNYSLRNLHNVTGMLNQFILERYLKTSIFSNQDLSKILKYLQ